MAEVESQETGAIAQTAQKINETLTSDEAPLIGIQVDKQDDQSKRPGEIPLEQVAAPVPVFNLVVLVRQEGNRFSARIANLDVESVEASTPRDAISRICASAKELLRSRHEANQEIPWIAPASPKRDGEDQFMVPVHL